MLKLLDKPDQDLKDDMRWRSLSESEQKIQDANILKFENFF
ncbi:hypothetical protein [Mesomycoplasma hyopneumoniae]|nr:hypothetical protein [Mesomycoplasma hyopneumoniae]